MHALLHIVHDCELFGSLDEFSCFPFENYLGQLKKQLRHSNKPLQQIVNRSVEKGIRFSNIKIQIGLFKPHNQGPLIDGMSVEGQYSRFKTESFISIIHNFSKNDAFILTKDCKIVQVENFVKLTTGDLCILGYYFTKTEDLYCDLPIRSSLIHQYQVGGLSTKLEMFNVTEIKSKIVLFSVNDIMIAKCLCHTL